MSSNPFALSKVSHVIAISSCKGGVGKSTIAAALALELAHRGFRTGLLDMDIFGPSLPALFQLHNIQAQINEFKMAVPIDCRNLKLMSFGFLWGDAPAVMRGPMVTKYIQQVLFQTDWGELDYLILDLPPGTGDVQLTITQSIKLTGAVIVTTQHTLSLVDTARGILMFEKVKVPILGVIENMAYFVTPDTGKKYTIFGEHKAGNLAQRFGIRTLVEIPILEALSLPMSQYQPDVYIQKAGEALLQAVKDGESSQAQLTETAFKEGQVVLTFSDGRVLAAKAFDLRVHCPCAGCVSETTGERMVDITKIPADIFPRDIMPLGHYAVNIIWSDNHSSGIYPYVLFEHLKH